jgi:serine/threonine-protein kinase HipA
MGLKVERFDVSATGGRYHLLTFNSLLKNEHDQDDSLTASYEDLVKMIRLYSDSPKADLQTLFGQMLINMAVRNTDDHLRNFSFISDGLGWRLSPVYDVVPNEDMATEHQLSCLRSHYLPSLTDALMAGKRCFGLGPSDTNAVIENVCGAIQEWPAIVKEAGMNENDQAFALKVVSHIG